ncbi:MAG TPA: patatin, partial [Gammaproteobacteria bacterium]
MGADVVIAVNLNGDLVGYDFFLRHEHLPETIEASSSAADDSNDNDAESRDTGNGSIVSKWTHSIRDRFDRYVAAKRDDSKWSPGLFDIVIGSIDIMQDRITRARMAGEPPDVHITPRLHDVGVMDFDRAEDAMTAGREATRNEKDDLLALKRVLDRMSSN